MGYTRLILVILIKLKVIDSIMLTYSTTKNNLVINDINSITAIPNTFASINNIAPDLSIVLSTDGVGSKIRLPGIYDTIGYDLVAMCVNDIITTGANPLYMQDYIGMNSLDQEVVSRIITSITKACKSCDVELTGGECAEMPGTYTSDVPELVGTAVGIVSDRHKLDKDNVRPGDIIVGLKSSGPHSNGYGLIHQSGIQGPEIYMPTVIYDKVVDVNQYNPEVIKSIAHITGGGIQENLSRAIPDHLTAHINYESWMVPKVFKDIQAYGPVLDSTMWSTFNMGVGMCLIVNTNYINLIIDELSMYDAFVMGYVI